MAAEAPRPVPPYEPKQISAMWWYCLHCRYNSVSETTLINHCRSQHEIFESVKGEDYTNGNHLRVLMGRWEAWSLLAVDKFALALDSLRGADDLVLDVGEGLKDE